MRSDPHFWRPCCLACGEVATDRLALGDAHGPHVVPRGELDCERCGEPVRLERVVQWAGEPAQPAADAPAARRLTLRLPEATR